MNGAKIAVKCLAEQGVTQVFAYPGASVLPTTENRTGRIWSGRVRTSNWNRGCTETTGIWN